MNNLETKLYENGRLATTVPTVPKVFGATFKKKTIYFLKLGLAVILLWFLIQKIEPRNLTTAFENARMSFVLLALALVIPNIYTQFLKWRFMLRLTMPAISDFNVFSSLLAGFALGFVTPGRLGEFGRGLFINNCSRTQVAGLAMVDKAASMSIVLVMGTWGLFCLSGIWLDSSLFTFWLILAIAALLFVLSLASFPEQIRHLLGKIENKLPNHKRISLLLSSIDDFKRIHAWKMLGLAFIFYGVICTQYVLLFQAFEPSNWGLNYLVVFSIFITKSMLPVSFGDLCIRESAAVYFVGLIGGLDATAFNASILIFLFNLVIPSLAGLIVILTSGLNRQLLNFKFIKNHPQ